MNDLIKRLRKPWFTNGCEQYQIEAADRLTAMKAAGDGLEDALADLLGATEEVGYVHYAPFRAKSRAALKQWKEASDGL